MWRPVGRPGSSVTFAAASASLNTARRVSSGSVAKAPPRPESEPPGGGPRAALLSRIRSEPAVAELLFEFGAQVVDVRTIAPGEETVPSRGQEDDA